jgi:hypothetical protein
MGRRTDNFWIGFWIGFIGMALLAAAVQAIAGAWS